MAFFWAKTTKAVLLSGSLVASFKFPPKLCNNEEELHDRAEAVDAIVARLSLSPIGVYDLIPFVTHRRDRGMVLLSTFWRPSKDRNAKVLYS